MNNIKPSLLKINESDYIAYHKTNGKKNKPGIVFLGGFMSDMEGTKATSLEKYCKEQEYDFIRFDYLGHGSSARKFTDCTIGDWLGNVLYVLDELTSKPQLVVGSSMGGWLMLLAALKRPEKIHALIGVASAPDFTENLIWNEMSEEQQLEMQKNGLYNFPSDYSDEPYPTTYKLIEEGRNHLILSDQINISCPVRLIHGMRDDDVPYDLSIELTKKLASEDVEVQLVKQGDHRMSSLRDIAIITEKIEALLAN